HTISGNVVLTQYIPPVEWLELSNDIGILSMASEDTIALSFNTNGMEIGEYTCLLKVFVNEDTVNIPIKLIVDEDVNIEQNQFINNILVYPNPSANSFTITSNFDSENIEYEVSDITGKLIWKAKSYNNESFKWTPNEDIETGMYLLRIKNGDQTYLRKLIFNR
ncbi:MAG: T9SS type A sorting domain-containing protein, partial [Bacteroidales bacterium]|nr:T9SS type A sorting domain-containing protein [Bacteroidales bacterium]